MPVWLKALGAFALVAAFGIAYTLLRHELGKEGERVDEFLRWTELIWYFGRWVLLAAALIGGAWWGFKAAP